MEKERLMKAIKEARESSNKKNFNQTIDMIVIFKDLDLKKPDNQLDFFMSLHHTKGKDVKVCGLVGPEMKENADQVFDTVVESEEFQKYAKDKKLIKKLADNHDFFVAQANLMAKVAQTFGRVLGPRNKMPNPKAGCVVPPNANLSTLKERLKMMVRVQVKSALQYQTAIGKEDMKDDDLVDNALTIYDQIMHHLPNEEQNIKDVMLKLTMGPAVKITNIEKPNKPGQSENTN